jgi:hypothetical protein
MLQFVALQEALWAPRKQFFHPETSGKLQDE